MNEGRARVKKSWANFNHFERMLGAFAALCAFALAGYFVVWGASSAFSAYGEQHLWKIVMATFMIGAFAAYGAIVVGLRMWEESKSNICASRKCNNTVASLDDAFCSECLAKKEQEEGAIASETPPDESAPMPPESADTTTLERCIKDGCQNACWLRNDGSGDFYDFCPDCWGKREREYEETGKLPGCIRKNCPGTAVDIYSPYCKDCKEFKNKGGQWRTADGRIVQSRGEKLIADFFYNTPGGRYCIRFEYERPLENSGSPPRKCDFFLPDGKGGGLYIEYAGMANHDDPTERERYHRKKMEWRRKYYAGKNLDWLEVLPEHLDNLEAHLTAELRKREYPIGEK